MFATMPDHFEHFVAFHESPGLLLIPFTRSTGAVIEGLLKVWLTWPAEDMRNQIRWLPRRPSSDPYYRRSSNQRKAYGANDSRYSSSPICGNSVYPSISIGVIPARLLKSSSTGCAKRQRLATHRI